MKKNSEGSIIEMIESYFEKAPALPKNIREVLVKFAPILSLVFGVLGLLSGIAGLGLLSVFAPFALLGGAKVTSSYGGGFISAITLIASSALMLAAYPGLKARKMNGWNMSFWSEVVSIVGAIISLQILSAIISALIGFYILFQIKSYYK